MDSTNIIVLSISISSAKGSQGDCQRGWHSSELNGPAEMRKKSCMVRSNQEVHQVGGDMKKTQLSAELLPFLPIFEKKQLKSSLKNPAPF